MAKGHSLRHRVSSFFSKKMLFDSRTSPRDIAHAQASSSNSGVSEDDIRQPSDLGSPKAWDFNSGSGSETSYEAGRSQSRSEEDDSTKQSLEVDLDIRWPSGLGRRKIEKPRPLPQLRFPDEPRRIAVNGQDIEIEIEDYSSPPGPPSPNHGSELQVPPSPNPSISPSIINHFPTPPQPTHRRTRTSVHLSLPASPGNLSANPLLPLPNTMGMFVLPPPLIPLILVHLPQKSILNACLVNRTWRAVVQKWVYRDVSFVGGYGEDDNQDADRGTTRMGNRNGNATPNEIKRDLFLSTISRYRHLALHVHSLNLDFTPPPHSAALPKSPLTPFSPYPYLSPHSSPTTTNNTAETDPRTYLLLSRALTHTHALQHLTLTGMHTRALVLEHTSFRLKSLRASFESSQAGVLRTWLENQVELEELALPFMRVRLDGGELEGTGTGTKTESLKSLMGHPVFVAGMLRSSAPSSKGFGLGLRSDSSDESQDLTEEDRILSTGIEQISFVPSFLSAWVMALPVLLQADKTSVRELNIAIPVRGSEDHGFGSRRQGRKKERVKGSAEQILDVVSQAGFKDIEMLTLEFVGEDDSHDGMSAGIFESVRELVSQMPQLCILRISHTPLSPFPSTTLSLSSSSTLSFTSGEFESSHYLSSSQHSSMLPSTSQIRTWITSCPSTRFNVIAFHFASGFSARDRYPHSPGKYRWSPQETDSSSDEHEDGDIPNINGNGTRAKLTKEEYAEDGVAVYTVRRAKGGFSLTKTNTGAGLSLGLIRTAAGF